MVAVTGVVPVSTAAKEAMLPVPLAPRPIDVLLLVQLYVVVPPVVGVENVTAAVLAPLHTVWLLTVFTLPDGFTVMVKVVAVPVQVVPLVVSVGVTTIMAVTGALPVFTAVNEAILPVPLAARPIDGVLFVQLNVVPASAPLKVTAVVAALLQTTWLLTAITVGVGFTVIVKPIGVPVQVTPLLVKVGKTTMFALIGVAPVLVAVKFRSPVPLDANPIAVLLFVH